MEKEQPMELEDVKKFYEENADFKRYVDQYCIHRGLSINDALQHNMVRGTAGYYMQESGT